MIIYSSGSQHLVVFADSSKTILLYHLNTGFGDPNVIARDPPVEKQWFLELKF